MTIMALNAEMETEEKHQLSAKIDNVKNVLHMLRVVNFKEVSRIIYCKPWNHQEI